MNRNDDNNFAAFGLLVIVVGLVALAMILYTAYKIAALFA